jgi:flagellar L-ring protein precursor FlgH
MAQAQTAQSSPGSLFVSTVRFSDPTRDFRANEVNDLITIIVNDTVSAVASGVTNTSRKTSAANTITGLVGITKATGPLANLANLSGQQQIQGTGQTSRNLTVTTMLSARVISVTPNGTLEIEGTKDMTVNSEKQSILIHGLVRPSDLTTANTILSTQIANLKIQINGKGVVGDAIRRPNILYRILLGILPF